MYGYYTIKVMKDTNSSIGEMLIDIICEFYENDRKARTFGTGTELYHSEIHMLQCIMEHPGLHISGIARELGVTRGAASQTAKRLVRKQMIVKEASPGDEKKIILRLTPCGKIAASNHKSAHKKYSAMIGSLLSGASTEQLQFLSGFLLRLKGALEKG